MTKSLSDEKQGHPGKCHLRSWGQRKAEQLCHCQQKYLWSHRHQLIYTFWLLRTHSQSDKTHPQSCKERREFEESRVRLHLLDSSQSHRLQVSFPPPLRTSKQRATSPQKNAANIEAESNVTACRDEDEKNKVQAESAWAEISLCVSVEDLRTANSAECCAFSRSGEKNCRYYLARDGSLSDLASHASTQWKLTEVNSKHKLVVVYKQSDKSTALTSTAWVDNIDSLDIN